MLRTCFRSTNKDIAVNTEAAFLIGLFVCLLFVYLFNLCQYELTLILLPLNFDHVLTGLRTQKNLQTVKGKQIKG